MIEPPDLPEVPNVRVPADPGPHRRHEGYEDRDNFVRNLRTLIGWSWPGGWDPYPGPFSKAGPLTKSARGSKAVVDLDAIKLHLRIEPEDTSQDEELALLEMAARLHTGNVLRREDPLDDTAGENIKLACLLLIAHWYRNRESVGDKGLVSLPLAYESLLSPERDYPGVY